MNLWYPEIRFEGTWHPVGAGHATRNDAEWALALWKQTAGATNDDLFRVAQHTMAVAEPDWLTATGIMTPF